MALWIALLLGVVQGVFMFVPVSSTSHLALTQHWLDARGEAIPDPESAEMILFDLVLHVGTLVSIVVVLRQRLWALVTDSRVELRQWWAQRGSPTTSPSNAGTPTASAAPRPALHLLRLLALSTVVTGVLGLGVREVAPAVFGDPVVIAAMLVITGAVLWWTDIVHPRGLVAPTVLVAVGIGAAQAMALLPGLSRSGLTIAAALALGMRRDQAAEYSFVLAIPTILLATAFQALDVGAAGALTLGWMSLAVGFVVAAAVGVVSLWAVLRLLYAARFRIFSFYVWALAVVVVVTGVGADQPGL